MTETCGNCRYAEPTVGDDADLFMACHRYPPAVFAVDGELSRTFPTVDASDWCGEWRPGEGADDG